MKELNKLQGDSHYTGGKYYRYPITLGCTLEHTGNGNIRSMDIESEPLNYKDINLVVMCHVLEHFRNPIEVLKKVRNILAPQGRLYIEVPSFHWAESRIKSVFTPEHMSFFTLESLTNVCNAAGFKIIKSHESKWWGNLKIIVTTDEFVDISIKKVDCQSVLRYHSLVKWQYPLYKIGRYFRTIDPND